MARRLQTRLWSNPEVRLLVNWKAICAATLAVTALASTSATAGVLVDHSPEALGTAVGFNVGDGSGGQNFLVEFTLAQASWISGMDIYSLSGAGVGEATTIKIRQNGTDGLPALTNLFSLSSTISDVQTVAVGGTFVQREHTSFAPILLSSGTWWMGDSTTTDSGSWVSIAGGVQQPTDQVQLSGNTFDQCCIGSTFPSTFTPFPNIYALAYQVEGSAAEPVSEPPIGPVLAAICAGWIALRVRTKLYCPTPLHRALPGKSRPSGIIFTV